MRKIAKVEKEMKPKNDLSEAQSSTFEVKN